MAVISHCGVDYTAPTVEVQSDASATSLEATKVPTGQTITSYLNSNSVKKTTSNLAISNNGVLKVYWTTNSTIQFVFNDSVVVCEIKPTFNKPSSGTHTLIDATYT